MRKIMSISLVLTLVLAGAALARPAGDLNLKIELYDASKSSEILRGSTTGVFGAAQTDTTFFGGTYWNADSSRWEAIIDSCWTFESGVGSSFVSDLAAPDPNVNQFKSGFLHAYMEGWVGLDNSFATTPYFRRLTTAEQAGSDSICTISESASLMMLVNRAEADELCYVGGTGYGSLFAASVEKSYNYSGSGNVTVAYDYGHEVEDNFDYAYFEVDTSGSGDIVDIVTYTGSASGSEFFTLTEGNSMRENAGPYKLVFRFASDSNTDDSDAFFETGCPFVVDDIFVNGSLDSDFETGADGWALSAPSPGDGGEWSDLVHESNLPIPQNPCECSLEDSVLVFFDPNIGGGGHTLEKDNVALSPWIDLKNNGQVGRPGKLLVLDFYADLPLPNYTFGWYLFRWYPDICSVTGKLITAPLQGDNFVIYFGPIPNCNSAGANPFRRDYSDVIPPGAEQLQAAIGIINLCDISFWAPICTGITNTTPWYDNVKMGVYGSATAPSIAFQSVNIPQDSWPQNGTLRLDAPGRFDGNNVKGGENTPDPFTSLGDTIVIAGAQPASVSGPQSATELFIEFAVDWGPGAPQPAGDNWLTAHANTGSFNGQTWYAARMDSAQNVGANAGPAQWMTAYHEEDPLFSGTDDDTDPADLDPLGFQSRLANDIFPEGDNGLFTPGTRINYFFKARYFDKDTGVRAPDWFLLPDTTGGTYLEIEVMPSSASADSTWNCILYVDHFDTDIAIAVAQTAIETGLGNALPGTSGNFEGTPWDRWDVERSSSQQLSFGRANNTQVGATVIQTFAYKVILWSAGANSAFNLTEEDANVLRPWLTLVDEGLGNNNLYATGNNLGRSMTLEAGSEPTAQVLLNQQFGVTWTCDTVRDASCPGTPALQDTTECMEVDPVAGARVGNSGPNAVKLQGNGCPQLRSFDLLATNAGAAIGNPLADEEYDSTVKGKVQWASITNEATGGPDYKTVLDGGSVHYRRASNCPPLGAPDVAGQAEIDDRLDRVLTWFGYTTEQASCDDVTAGLDVPVGDTRGGSAFTNKLGLMAPNPLPLGSVKGRISFSVDRDTNAEIRVFDVNGRLVKTIFDGLAAEGVNEAFWDGTDKRGSSVASGVYFYGLYVDDLKGMKQIDAKKMVVVDNGGR